MNGHPSFRPSCGATDTLAATALCSASPSALSCSLPLQVFILKTVPNKHSACLSPCQHAYQRAWSISSDYIMIECIMREGSRFNIALGKTVNIYCCPFYVNVNVVHSMWMFFSDWNRKECICQLRGRIPCTWGHVNLLANLRLTQQLQMGQLLGWVCSSLLGSILDFPPTFQHH